MPIPYKHKRSTAAGVAPSTLQDGEIAINVAASDPKLFYKDSSSTIRAFSLASYASASHTHVVADVTDFTTKANVVSVNGITGAVVLTSTGVSAASASHSHVAANITDFAAEAAKYGPVTSVNSLTGTIVLTSLGVSAASAVHSHVAADITNFTSVANVVSVNAKTGVVSISHTDVTAASASHTHAASDITSGTLDAARLPLATTIAAGAVIVGTGLGVSSGTVSVTYGTSAGTACQGNDSRLSDARTPTSHSHGNITNAGAIGSTANLPIITTTSGVLTTGSFGTSAATFCEGNDSRLSDTRTPTDGSVTTAKIANDAVTYAKIQNVSATDRLLGRSSAGSGDVEEVTCTAFGRSLIDDADAAAARSTLSVQPTASPAFTGTFSCGDTVNIGTASATATIINVGNGATGNRFALIDIIGDTTYTDYGLRIGRDNTGANGQSIIHHRGTGEIAIVAIDAGSVQLGTSSTARLTISSAGVSTFSGQLLVTTGSASACGVAFSGDPDTGIAQLSAAGANTLSICTNSAERVRVDASGRLGIGISPSTLLHLNSLGVLRLQTGSVTMDCTPTAGATDSFVWNTSANAAYRWSMNGTERVRIESDGKLYAYSTYETTVGGTNRDLFIDSGGLIGYVSSIRASKTNIAAIDDVSWLRDLTPVSFHYRKRNEDGTYSDEPDGTLDYGLIAEEVEPVAPELCFYDVVDGEPQLRGVHYSKLITPMLRYIQQLEARIAALEERVNA